MSKRWENTVIKWLICLFSWSEMKFELLIQYIYLTPFGLANAINDSWRLKIKAKWYNYKIYHIGAILIIFLKSRMLTPVWRPRQRIKLYLRMKENWREKNIHFKKWRLEEGDYTLYKIETDKNIPANWFKYKRYV